MANTDSDRTDEDLKAIFRNMPELNKQLQWLVHKYQSSSGQKKEKAKKKLDDWLERHVWMKGKAKQLLGE